MKTIIILIVFLSTLLSKPLPIQKPRIYEDQNISGWIMSEKLDGIRGIWDGKHLYSKNGNLIHTPKYFTKDFPPFALDGEIWSKRGDFENIQSIVLDHKPSLKWKMLTYNVFEVPYEKGDFLTRLEKVKSYQSKYLKIIKQIKCKDNIQLQNFLKDIESKGGEGVVIKNPDIDYFTGRSSQILKVKSFRDMEGEVIAYNKGKGKYKNFIGSLQLKLKNGVVFNLGSGLTDNLRRNPPPLGSMVTFKYYGFTKYKKPKFAVFIRIRNNN